MRQAMIPTLFLVAQAVAWADRVDDHAQLLYRFSGGEGDVIEDTSGAAEPIDLFFNDPDSAVWEPTGLRLRRATAVVGAAPPARVAQACRESGEVSLEAWLTPADLRQEGPARVFSFSADPSRGNFTLGQEADRWIVRLRTDQTDGTGHSHAIRATFRQAPMLRHIVFTRDAAGMARVYVDGEPRLEQPLPGDFFSWDPAFRLALGNEVEADRTWLGEIHLAAVYDTALTAAQTRWHHAAGRAAIDDEADADLVVEPLALYRFGANAAEVADDSGVEPLLPLRLADPAATERTPGLLRLIRPTRVVSSAPADKLREACQLTGQISLEVWCRPQSLAQSGPARIFTCSVDGSRRNWSLAQENDAVVVRLRTSTTGDNGMNPELMVPGVFGGGATHIVYTRDAAGAACLYLNGELAAEREVPGTLDTWDSDMMLMIGNELTEDRPWLGVLHLLAVHDRALSDADVLANFRAGY